jgi:hypothetical protein
VQGPPAGERNCGDLYYWTRLVSLCPQRRHSKVWRPFLSGHVAIMLIPHFGQSGLNTICAIARGGRPNLTLSAPASYGRMAVMSVWLTLRLAVRRGPSDMVELPPGITGWGNT